jgi:hypothetical protein
MALWNVDELFSLPPEKSEDNRQNKRNVGFFSIGEPKHPIQPPEHGSAIYVS